MATNSGPQPEDIKEAQPGSSPTESSSLPISIPNTTFAAAWEIARRPSDTGSEQQEPSTRKPLTLEDFLGKQPGDEEFQVGSPAGWRKKIGPDSGSPPSKSQGKRAPKK